MRTFSAFTPACDTHSARMLALFSFVIWPSGSNIVTLLP